MFTVHSLRTLRTSLHRLESPKERPALPASLYRPQQHHRDVHPRRYTSGNRAGGTPSLNQTGGDNQLPGRALCHEHWILHTLPALRGYAYLLLVPYFPAHQVPEWLPGISSNGFKCHRRAKSRQNVTQVDFSSCLLLYLISGPRFHRYSGG